MIIPKMTRTATDLNLEPLAALASYLRRAADIGPTPLLNHWLRRQARFIEKAIDAKVVNRG